MMRNGHRYWLTDSYVYPPRPRSPLLSVARPFVWCCAVSCWAPVGPRVCPLCGPVVGPPPELYNYITTCDGKFPIGPRQV